MKDQKPPKRRSAAPKGAAATRQPRRTQPTQTQRGTLNRIGALWLKDGKNGKFMSGTLQLSDNESIRLLVFRNGYKQQDGQNAPDYVIYEPEQQQATTDRNRAAGDWKGGKGRADYDDSDIPF